MLDEIGQAGLHQQVGGRQSFERICGAKMSCTGIDLFDEF